MLSACTPAAKPSRHGFRTLPRRADQCVRRAGARTGAAAAERLAGFTVHGAILPTSGASGPRPAARAARRDAAGAGAAFRRLLAPRGLRRRDARPQPLRAYQGCLRRGARLRPPACRGTGRILPATIPAQHVVDAPAPARAAGAGVARCRRLPLQRPAVPLARFRPTPAAGDACGFRAHPGLRWPVAASARAAAARSRGSSLDQAVDGGLEIIAA